MDNENEIIEDTIDEETLEDIEETDTTDWKAEAEKARGIAQRLKTKLEKANKPKEEKEEKSVPVKKEATTDGLDETQLDYLDLKGVSDEDEIAVIEGVIKKTGQTVRQALKDDYVIAKLEKLRADKAVKDATPSSTKRSGNQQSDSSSIISKFEATGVMPEDFASRNVIVDYLVKKDRSNAPSWHK